MAVASSRSIRRCVRVSTGRHRASPQAWLAGIAHACIDISDGLLADLGHVCRASRVGAQIDVDALPASVALVAAFDAAARRELQSSGGDDYELCFTAPKTARLAVQAAMDACDVTATRIGRIVVMNGGALLCDAAGVEWSLSGHGYEHFDGAASRADATD